MTKSESGRILEIDGKPAIEFYRHYLGDTPVAALAAPLAIYEDIGDSHYLRGPIRFDDEGAAVVQGRVPEGARIRITLSSSDEIVSGAGVSAARAPVNYPEGCRAEAALVSACAIRNVLLGGRSAEEIVSIRRAIGEDIPVQGLYAYGEIAPLARSEKSRFHNHTCCTVLIGT